MTASRFAHGLTESGEAWSIAYSVQGQGPDIVLLHGGGPGATGASNYSRNIEALARRFHCWRCSTTSVSNGLRWWAIRSVAVWRSGSRWIIPSGPAGWC